MNKGIILYGAQDILMNTRIGGSNSFYARSVRYFVLPPYVLCMQVRMQMFMNVRTYIYAE